MEFSPDNASLYRPVALLGMAQIIAWGSLAYSIAVLAPSMSRDLDIALSTVFAAFSASLATSGLAAPLVGRAIDARGGRWVLAGGSVLAAFSLALIALAQGPLLFFVGWIIAGVAMAANLYDAAFAALSQFAGTRYRQALTALTLLGGLASTVFWPLAWQIDQHAGWRVALGVFALMHVAICFPIHRFGLPRVRIPSPMAETPRAPVQEARLRRCFVWIAVAFTLAAFVVSGMAAHVVGALQASGLDAPTAIFAASLIGPMQVVGRLLEFGFARKRAATSVGLASFIVMLIAMVLLSLAGVAPGFGFACAVTYGLANGVLSIVRGTVPAELFGRDGYGALMGRLAQPAFFAKALAPLLIALLIPADGSYARVALLFIVLAALALIAYAIAIRGANA